MTTQSLSAPTTSPQPPPYPPTSIVDECGGEERIREVYNTDRQTIIKACARERTPREPRELITFDPTDVAALIDAIVTELSRDPQIYGSDKGLMHQTTEMGRTVFRPFSSDNLDTWLGRRLSFETRIYICDAADERSEVTEYISAPALILQGIAQRIQECGMSKFRACPNP